MHFWRILIKGICVLAKARSRSSHFIISVYTQWTQHHLSRIICKRGRGRDILLVCGQICRDFRARYCAALGADFSRMASPSQQPWLGALSCTHTQPMVYVCIYGVLWGGGYWGSFVIFLYTLAFIEFVVVVALCVCVVVGFVSEFRVCKPASANYCVVDDVQSSIDDDDDDAQAQPVEILGSSTSTHHSRAPQPLCCWTNCMQLRFVVYRTQYYVFNIYIRTHLYVPLGRRAMHLIALGASPYQTRL